MTDKSKALIGRGGCKEYSNSEASIDHLDSFQCCDEREEVAASEGVQEI